MKTINRREFLERACYGAAGVWAATNLVHSNSALSASAKQDKPNIIFIMADDLGYGDLGCYGQEVIQTPNIDQLAREGIRFTDCYAGSTVCAPSRCCLMTGYHTGHARVRGNARVPLRPQDTTVAEILKQAGYTTGIFGKWGLGEPESTGIPNKKGFDEWFGYLNQRHAHNYYPEFLWKNKEWIWLRKNSACQQGAYSHDLIMEEALKFIDKNAQKPFFLYLALTIPHANNEMGRATGDGMQVPSDEPYSDKPWPQTEKSFAAMVTLMDKDIGRLMALLKEKGIDENTIVFFTSDNGPHREGGHDPQFFKSSGPLRGIKRDLYEGGIRVPMIARWPGKIKPGRVSGRAWAFWDFLPTAAELAGVKAPSGIDGISMVPELLGKPQKDHEYLYWEFHERGFSQAIRMGKWKAVRPGRGKAIELYNLEDDLGEQKNIAALHPNMVSKAEEIFKSARTESEFWPVKNK